MATLTCPDITSCKLEEVTCGLWRLHSSSEQRSQQLGNRRPDVVVGAFEGSEAEGGDVLQLAGPQEERLPLQLQQALRHRKEISSSSARCTTCRRLTWAAAQRTANERSVRQLLATL